ncbi:MAG: ABC transporter ATP-binding protein [Candidatus Omnitrophica bacterium]|nr:ABC transporter ATP-binding protein [Candidatus Omnitrophota bacterium]
MEEILRCEGVQKLFIVKDFFGVKKRKIKALNNISFTVEKGINLGIVGESGSGKTTLAKILLLLIKPDAGSIFYKGINITKLPDSKLQSFRNRVRIVFQNPYKSLNPRMTVEKTLKEAMLSKRFNEKDIERLLKQTGLPVDYKNKYPHQMSGGERQRVAIARALAGDPECIIADEPTGSLDVATEMHILKLLESLKATGITFIFISHNLKIVGTFCEKIIVMYKGNIVEQGPTQNILEDPLHPYTKLLWNPESIDNTNEQNYKNDEGCPFASRCPERKSICAHSSPQLKEKEKSHFVSCFLYY